MPVPKRYEILRGVVNGGPWQPLPEPPLQVWTLLNEHDFLVYGLRHGYSAFIEDTMHGWDWRKGQFKFYGHSGGPGELHNLVIVYEK